jgi:antitoxin MazE
MKKKLAKHGNSLAIVIDKPILKLLAINENTVFTLTTDGTSIILKPVRSSKKKISNDTKMQKLYEDIVEHYAPALKKLAKN